MDAVETETPTRGRNRRKRRNATHFAARVNMVPPFRPRKISAVKSQTARGVDFARPWRRNAGEKSNPRGRSAPGGVVAYGDPFQNIHARWASLRDISPAPHRSLPPRVPTRSLVRRICILPQRPAGYDGPAGTQKGHRSVARCHRQPSLDKRLEWEWRTAEEKLNPRGRHARGGRRRVSRGGSGHFDTRRQLQFWNSSRRGPLSASARAPYTIRGRLARKRLAATSPIRLNMGTSGGQPPPIRSLFIGIARADRHHIRACSLRPCSMAV